MGDNGAWRIIWYRAHLTDESHFTISKERYQTEADAWAAEEAVPLLPDMEYDGMGLTVTWVNKYNIVMDEQGDIMKYTHDDHELRSRALQQSATRILLNLSSLSEAVTGAYPGIDAVKRWREDWNKLAPQWENGGSYPRFKGLTK